MTIWTEWDQSRPISFKTNFFKIMSFDEKVLKIQKPQNTKIWFFIQVRSFCNDTLLYLRLWIVYIGKNEDVRYINHYLYAVHALIDLGKVCAVCHLCVHAGNPDAAVHSNYLINSLQNMQCMMYTIAI